MMQYLHLKKTYISLAVVALVLCSVFLLFSDKETRAQYGGPEVDEDFMKMMHPVELARTYVTDDDLPRQIADFKWKLFNEYQKKGFTRDEAVQLVISGGIPFSAAE